LEKTFSPPLYVYSKPLYMFAKWYAKLNLFSSATLSERVLTGIIMVFLVLRLFKSVWMSFDFNVFYSSC